ncbi:MAG: amino acid ABC transporter permease [Caldilineaceae bacterium]|nr:amino acid ABC transporter permease [Caldilineaceae bacterium]MCB9139226.1 amino acid ABC transporter permease [Caldilineaceae bacterium]
MEPDVQQNSSSNVSAIARGLPWWLFIIVGGLLLFALFIMLDPQRTEYYRDAFTFILPGVSLTLRVTIFSYLLALIIGLFVGLMRLSSNPIIFHLSTVYVEVMRGLPMLVIILYAGFVIGPAVRDGSGGLYDPPMLHRAITGLALGYGAYISEVFRSGIQAIGKGQMEAARSLGMGYIQAMRYIILPQAVRLILPPLGNDLIALLKDSALISVLALEDTLQLGRQYISRTFRAFEGYNTVAVIFLSMTLVLSLIVRYIEQRTKTG